MDVVCGEGTLVGFDLIYRRPDKTEERRGEERRGEEGSNLLQSRAGE